MATADEIINPDLLARESELREALRDVQDPEIGMSIVDLGLIRNIEFQPDETVVTMIMTTPFCPAAGWLIDQVRLKTIEVTNGPSRVVLGDEMWTPDMMEVDDWGLGLM
ncbi:MAG: metal-sulfur cluster assembly factor [Anaerolineae bacterium]